MEEELKQNEEAERMIQKQLLKQELEEESKKKYEKNIELSWMICVPVGIALTIVCPPIGLLVMFGIPLFVTYQGTK